MLPLWKLEIALVVWTWMLVCAYVKVNGEYDQEIPTRTKIQEVFNVLTSRKIMSLN